MGRGLQTLPTGLLKVLFPLRNRRRGRWSTTAMATGRTIGGSTFASAPRPRRHATPERSAGRHASRASAGMRGSANGGRRSVTTARRGPGVRPQGAGTVREIRVSQLPGGGAGRASQREDRGPQWRTRNAGGRHDPPSARGGLLPLPPWLQIRSAKYGVRNKHKSPKPETQNATRVIGVIETFRFWSLSRYSVFEIRFSPAGLRLRRRRRTCLLAGAAGVWGKACSQNARRDDSDTRRARQVNRATSRKAGAASAYLLR